MTTTRKHATAHFRATSLDEIAERLPNYVTARIVNYDPGYRRVPNGDGCPPNYDIEIEPDEIVVEIDESTALALIGRDHEFFWSIDTHRVRGPDLIELRARYMGTLDFVLVDDGTTRQRIIYSIEP